MEPDNMEELLMNRQQQAKNLQRLFDQKILDIFLKECEELMKSGINLKEFSQFYKLDYNMEEQYQSMKRVISESDRLINIALAQEEGWKTIQMDEKCTISVRANNSIMELKSKGILDLSMKQMLIVAYLIKHYKACIPFCKEAYDIQQPTKLEKVGFIRLSLPIPFVKDRSTLLRGIGFQCENKPYKAVIYAEGITENKEYLERLKIESATLMKNRELLDFKHFAVEMTCLGSKQVEYTGYAMIDHHISALPERLVMFVTKQMGKHIFNKLIKELKKFQQTIWAKQLKENYEQNAFFYDWIEEKMKKWISEIETVK